jgi:hypothetical protein
VFGRLAYWACTRSLDQQSNVEKVKVKVLMTSI